VRIDEMLDDYVEQWKLDSHHSREQEREKNEERRAKVHEEFMVVLRRTFGSGLIESLSPASVDYEPGAHRPLPPALLFAVHGEPVTLYGPVDVELSGLPYDGFTWTLRRINGEIATFDAGGYVTKLQPLPAFMQALAKLFNLINTD
jgi:hypothetical protein